MFRGVFGHVEYLYHNTYTQPMLKISHKAIVVLHYQKNSAVADEPRVKLELTKAWSSVGIYHAVYLSIAG